jgi:shikimate kinase
MPNIFLVGPMGAGKTTIGKLLASELCYDFVDSDKEIEARTGANIAWIFDVEGEEGFRRREKNIIETLNQQNNQVIATGGGAVLNEDTRKLLKACPYTIYVHAPIKTLLERTAQDKSRPLLQVKNPEQVFKKILNDREHLYKEVASLSLSSAEFSTRQVVNKIIAFMNENK